MVERNEQVVAVTLRWAVLLLGVETLLVIAALVFLIYEGIAGSAQNPGLASFMIWYTAGYAVGFALATWGLHRRSRWARTPALVLNLFLLPIGWFMTQAGLWWVGLPVIGYSLGVAYLLVAAPTREALGIR